MNKKQIIFLSLVMIIIVVIVDLLIGNYLSARLATTSIARKWGLFNPQAPIVVNNREIVRVNSNSDAVDTAENARNKTATIVFIDGNSVVASGSAVNWTSDGMFVTVDGAMSYANKVYAVVTSNGDLYPIEKAIQDPASNLIILQTSARNLSIFSPLDPRELRIGQQFVTVQSSVSGQKASFFTGYIKKIANDFSQNIQESDSLRNFTYLNIVDTLPAGSPILSLSGRLVGIWDGVGVVMSQDISDAVNNYLAGGQSFNWPKYGFVFQLLSESEAKFIQTIPGARVLSVLPNTSASKAGLLTNDVIIEIDGQKVDHNFDLARTLRFGKAGQAVSLLVERYGKQSVILVTPD